MAHCHDSRSHAVSLRSESLGPGMDREAELRADYETLGQKLRDAEGSAAAAIVRERRLISLELERIGASAEASLVDELAKRRAGSGAGRAPARRRKS